MNPLDFQTVKLPFSEDLECAMLASIVKSPEILDEVAFSHKMFYIPANALMFRNLVECYSDTGSIDWHSFLETFNPEELAEVGGVPALNKLWGFIPTAANWRSYYELVLELYYRREGWKLLSDLAGKVVDKEFDFGEKTVKDAIESGLAAIEIDPPEPELTVKEEMMAALKTILARKPGQGMLEVSNIRALNLSVGCLLPGDEVVIGAETSFGKTALAMHFVAHLCFGPQRKKVALFSMEMRKQNIWERVFAAMAEVPLENIRRNDLSEAEESKIRMLISNVPQGHYVFMDDDPTLSIQSIITQCRRLKRKHGLDAVVVDYLQLVSPANLKFNSNRQQEVADISRRLKMLAVELDVVVIALSQLNDAGQLRESRAIGQDADIVMFIREGDKRDSSDKQIVIEKNRNGPKGEPISVKFHPQFVSFGNGMKLDTPSFL